MTKLNYHKSSSDEISLKSRYTKDRKVSTLIIPPRYLKEVRKKGVTRLLEKALTTQSHILKTRLRINKSSPNIKYQTSLGTKARKYYTKINFRPKPEHWAQLRSLALSHGVSMCYLFIFLLEALLLNSSLNKASTVWQLKATLRYGLQRNTLVRDLWITEFVKEDVYENRRRESSDPKIA